MLSRKPMIALLKGLAPVNTTVPAAVFAPGTAGPRPPTAPIDPPMPVTTS
jgi:hypothetical protein